MMQEYVRKIYLSKAIISLSGIFRFSFFSSNICLLSLSLCLATSSPLYAQYFGRNKVQYEKFDFKVLHTSHFNIYYYSETEKTINDIAQLSEQWYQKYSTLFRHSFVKPNPIIIYANDADFRQTEIVNEQIDIGVGGVTEALKIRLVMPLAESYKSTNHVLGHEMLHVFQYDMLLQNDSLSLYSIYNLPLWFIEGMAEYYSLGRNDPHTAMWMRDAVLHYDVPSLKKVSTDYKYFPYRYGHAIWACIAGYWGDTIIPPLFLKSVQVGFDRAVKEVLKISSDSLSLLWQHTLTEAYTPFIKKYPKRQGTGKRVLAPDIHGGEMNLAPSISPDGKYVAFLSEKDIFTIDLFLADATSGKIIRKLASSSGNAHYDALNFLESAGTWSPDSKEIAFVVFSKGSSKIIIIDINSGKIKREIKFESVRRILNPSWSPDGKYLVFSGAKGGMTDLYIYNLEKDYLNQLTNDKYADLQPEWSPDGENIVFVTDREAPADSDNFIPGSMKIALLNFENEKITLLPLFVNAKHINPKYDATGKFIYFISDPNGISNIYRYDFESTEILQVTDVATGISGITELSPALTISHENNLLAFSVFEHQDYIVYAISTEQIKGPSVEERKNFSRNGELQPVVGRQVKEIIREDISFVLSRKDTFYFSDYKPKIQLDYIGNVYVGAAVDQYTTGVAGGASFQFSDVLNQHAIYTILQINGQLKNSAAQVLYVNKSHRFIWGPFLSHIPYLSSSVFIRKDTFMINGTLTTSRVIDQLIQRTVEDKIALTGKYPFSATNRLDLSTGYTHVNYNIELVRNAVTNNQLTEEQTRNLNVPPDIDLTQVSAAYVGDKAYFGLTAPLKGFRYRFQTEANIGTYNFATILADYRRYIRTTPFTFAFRAMHYGRYFEDAESGFLSPLFLGYEYLVRGYSIYSFEYSECDDPKNGGCPVFNRLTGSKIAVTNLELRLPFTGPKQLAVIKSKHFFSSINAFFDGGLAWKANDPPVFSLKQYSMQRIPVFSAGLAARVNLMGVMILELYYAYPFQRPVKGPHFGFQITPGW